MGRMNSAVRPSTVVGLTICLTLVGGCLSGKMRAANQDEVRVLGKTSRPARLGTEPTWMVLTNPATASPLTRAALRDVADGRRLMLVLNDISAEAPPGSAFDVFLGVAAAETPSKDDPRHVGSLSFYNEINHGTLKATPSSRSYDVTDVVRRLSASNTPDAPIGVTIVAARTPSPDARPTIGSIEIVLR